MTPSIFDTLIVITFVNAGGPTCKPQRHAWVTDSKQRALELIEELEEAPHIEQVEAYDANCYPSR